MIVRGLAVAALNQVLNEGVSVDDALDALPELAPRDRGFLMAMVLTTLRHRGEIDAVIAVFLAKPLPRKSGSAALILMLGAAQLLFLDTPAHAAIDVSVRLAKADANATHFSGLINAVLRKIAVGGQEKLKGADGPRLNTPDWLWQRWSKAYGVETAHKIAAAHMLEPAIDITGSGLQGTLLPTGSIRLDKTQGAIENLPGFHDGAWWVQDAAAAIPAKLLGELKGKTAVDLCAAPGGKTLQLCAAGATVTAVDNSAIRLERLRDNLKRAKFAAEVVVSDVLAMTGQFDAVLLDAPCSSTGTIRRHPDLPYLKTATQIAGLIALQARMLAHAATLVQPGGLLVYCTCSLEPQEGERQIDGFLAANPAFRIAPITAGECGIEAHMITPQGTLRTLPFMTIGGQAGLDGFYAARLSKAF